MMRREFVAALAARRASRRPCLRTKIPARSDRPARSPTCPASRSATSPIRVVPPDARPSSSTSRRPQASTTTDRRPARAGRHAPAHQPGRPHPCDPALGRRRVSASAPSRARCGSSRRGRSATTGARPASAFPSSSARSSTISRSGTPASGPIPSRRTRRARRRRPHPLPRATWEPAPATSSTGARGDRGRGAPRRRRRVCGYGGHPEEEPGRREAARARRQRGPRAAQARRWSSSRPTSRTRSPS